MSVISSQDAAPRHLLVPAASASKDGSVEALDPRRLAAGADIRVGPEPALVWIARGAVNLERRSQRGNWRPLLLRHGDFYLSTSETIQLRRAHQCRSDFEGIRLELSTLVLSRCTHEPGDATAWQGREIRGSADPTLRALLTLLRPSACQSAALTTPFVDGVTQAVAAQLASYPANARRKPGGQHHGLAPYKFRLVLRAMRERLAEPFDLGYLAGLAGLSTFHFSRAFKKASGLPPSRYFQRLRIDQARRMLAEGERSVIDIALAVGFRSPSHFSQVFRQAAGFSPSEYRQRFAMPPSMQAGFPCRRAAD
ncbi:hypothetical protein B0920_12305 [Massilia sp. KIM]|uniref:helix-turn-helix domain-containing protein n=1 Tax=Massilia sp. KIM TaxID=1955422 RepID=UPI00098F92FE|nr:helix-turn-helix domain-containing protein [Massilia sp. KIM]OON64073.1 hypothetical protein B0920_12305 [Massilia sp. KIM]